MNIYQGDRTYGAPAFTMKDDKVYQGDRTFGVPFYTIK